MTNNLKTTELIDAVISLINGASMGFTPVIIQEGTLDHWVENEDLPSDVPAVLVTCTAADLISEVITGECWEVSYPMRILLVDTWEYGDNVRDIQQQRAEAVAQVFIGATGASYDLAASIAGLEFILALPTRIDFEPGESQILSMGGARRLFAVAVHLNVRTQSVRV